MPRLVARRARRPSSSGREILCITRVAQDSLTRLARRFGAWTFTFTAHLWALSAFTFIRGLITV